MAEEKKKELKPAGSGGTAKQHAAKKEKLVKPYKKGGKTCPKCGPGIRLAEHNNRSSCGKCGYFEKK